MAYYHDYDVDSIAEHVRERLEMDEQYAYEKQRGYAEKQRRRLLELIVEVVRDFTGRVIPEVVAKVRSYFGV